MHVSLKMAMRTFLDYPILATQLAIADKIY